MLALFGVLGGVGLGAAGAGHVVAPVFVEFAEDFELLVFGEIHLVAFHLGGVVRGGGVGVVGADFAAGIGVAVGGVVLGGGVVEADSLHRKFFECGVALEFLLNDRTQVQRRDLKDFQRMSELGRENQRLGLALAKFVTKSVPAHMLDEKERGSSQMGARVESVGRTGSLMPKSSFR